METDPIKNAKNILKRAKKATSYRKVKFKFLKRVMIEGQAEKMSKNLTAPEREFENILKQLKINYKPQKVVGGFIYDYYLIDKNILVEVDGDYYHSNPEKFQQEDLNEMQLRNQKRDKRKDVVALGLGYKIVRFWENDIMKNGEFVILELKKIL